MLSSNEICYIITFIIYALFSAMYTAWTGVLYYLEYIELKLAPQYLKRSVEYTSLDAIKQLLMFSNTNTFHSKVRLCGVISAAEYDFRTQTAVFKSTRVNIAQLRAFLDLLLPAFRTYPWNQMVTSAGLHMAILCGLAKRVVEEEPKAVHDGYLLTSLVADEYGRWCEVLDSYRLMFGTNDLMDELMFNYRYHLERAGRFGGWARLPAEVKEMILKKVPIQFNQTYVRDEAGRLYRVSYRVWSKRNTTLACLYPCRLANKEMQTMVEKYAMKMAKKSRQRARNELAKLDE